MNDDDDLPDELEVEKLRMTNSALRADLQQTYSNIGKAGGLLLAGLLVYWFSSGGSESEESEKTLQSREEFMSECLSSNGGDMAACAEKWGEIQ